MPAPPLLLLQDVDLALGTGKLLDGAGIGVSAGERICLVGRNGSGKSTLLKIAAGELAFDSGTRFLQPGATMRYLPQEPDLRGYRTVLDYVQAGLPEEQAHRAGYLLAELELSGAEDPLQLSGGGARRAAIARALAPKPDILLLDEPTNHLDLPAIAWLEAEIAALAAGIVLISHDRKFLETLSRAVVWLDGGRTRRLDRGFEAFETWRDEVLAEEERDFHKLGRKIAREEDWMRYGVTARRKRNVRRVAELAALRAQKRAEVRGQGTANLAAADAATSGKLVAVAEGVGKAFGDRPIVKGLDLRVLRGDRLGIAGPNGAGKTTLLNLLTGQLKPDAGRIVIGTNLEVVTLDQQRAALNPRATLADTLTAGKGDLVQVGTERRHVIGYMKDFLFKPEQARTPVGTLSGGERGRLALALALARPANFLVLDEPTNDLDLETLDMLQEMLAAFRGTILLVSHDRDFLDRVATSTLMAEGGGRWTEYAGGYTDMLAQRQPAPQAAATVPKARPTRAAPAPNATKTLSFRQLYELKTLEAEILKLQQEIAQQEAVLAVPDFYARDPNGFAAAGAGLAAAVARKAAAEDRWLELEMLRDAS